MKKTFISVASPFVLACGVACYCMNTKGTSKGIVETNVEALSSVESQYKGVAYKVEETRSDFYRYDTTVVDNNKIKIFKVFLVTTITTCVGQGDVACSPNLHSKEVKEEL